MDFQYSGRFIVQCEGDRSLLSGRVARNADARGIGGAEKGSGLIVSSKGALKVSGTYNVILIENGS